MQTIPSPQATRGFTLVELMIVVAIVAVLTAIAVPSYLKYVQQGRRSDAMAALTQDQGILERCYAQSFNYTNVTTGTNGCGTLSATTNPSPKGYYNVALAPATTSAYTLTATPVAGSPQLNDTQCTSFALTSGNVHTATGTPAATATSTCWQQ